MEKLEELLIEQDEKGWNLAMHVASYNSEKNLNLTSEQLMDIFRQSDLSQQDKDGRNLAMFIDVYNSAQKLNLTSDQLLELKQENNRSKTSFATALQKIRNKLNFGKIHENPEDDSSPEIGRKLI